MYDYMATVVGVHDGDTVTLDVDLGFNIHFQLKCRLDGINAPELPTDAGMAAGKHLKELILRGGNAVGRVHVLTNKDKQEKFGRYLAILWSPTIEFANVSINKQMIDDGFAVEYHGGAR